MYIVLDEGKKMICSIHRTKNWIIVDFIKAIYIWSYDQSFDPNFGARPNWVKDITVLHILSIIVKGEAK